MLKSKTRNDVCFNFLIIILIFLITLFRFTIQNTLKYTRETFLTYVFEKFTLAVLVRGVPVDF